MLHLASRFIFLFGSKATVVKSDKIRSLKQLRKINWERKLGKNSKIIIEYQKNHVKNNNDQTFN